MEQRLGSSSQDILEAPVQGGRSLTTAQRQALDLSAQIPGWGSDLDPAKRPGVPRDKAPDIGPDDLYPPIEPQASTVKVHKSTEHAQLPPVYGTSCPPRGLSGLIRDAAYKLSEGRLTRWMALLVADRVNMVEGLLEDVAHLRIPNIPKEMGLKSEFKYNRAGVVKKAAIVGGLGFAAYLIYRGTRRER